MNNTATAKTTSNNERLDPNRFPPLPPIPNTRYTDNQLYQQEIEHVFKKQWLFVGHDCEFKKVGSYKLLDIPFAPVMVVRGKDNKLRAFLNSCQHRGATVLREKEGCTKVMSCQYHGWTYDLTGQLIGVTSEECFPGLKKEDHSLPELRLEQWGGVVFINFDQSAPPLLDWLAPSTVKTLGNELDANAEQSLRVLMKLSWDVPCNWKAQVDNFWESYHFHYIHKDTVRDLMDFDSSHIGMFQNGHGSITTDYQKNVEWKGMLKADDQGLPLMPNISPERKIVLDKANTTYDFFPNSIMSLSTSGLTFVEMWPTGQDTCRFDLVMYVKDWGDGPMPKAYQDVMDMQDAVAQEDLYCMASIQQSLKANPNGHINLSSKEILLYQLHTQIDKCIGVDNISENLRIPDVLADYVTR